MPIPIQFTLEDLVMAHRYLYYVKCASVISDYDYDRLERVAMYVTRPSSPVHQVSGDTEDSYTTNQKELSAILTKFYT